MVFSLQITYQQSMAFIEASFWFIVLLIDSCLVVLEYNCLVKQNETERTSIFKPSTLIFLESKCNFLENACTRATSLRPIFQIEWLLVDWFLQALIIQLC